MLSHHNLSPTTPGEQLERVEIIHALAKIGAAATAEVRAALAEVAAKDTDPELRALASSYLRDLGD